MSRYRDRSPRRRDSRERSPESSRRQRRSPVRSPRRDSHRPRSPLCERRRRSPPPRESYRPRSPLLERRRRSPPPRDRGRDGYRGSKGREPYDPKHDVPTAAALPGHISIPFYPPPMPASNTNGLQYPFHPPTSATHPVAADVGEFKLHKTMSTPGPSLVQSPMPSSPSLPPLKVPTPLPTPTPTATAEEVGKWIASLGAGFVGYEKCAIEHNIDGAVLHDIAKEPSIAVRDEVMREGGIPVKIHARAILNRVHQLQALIADGFVPKQQ